ncbi:DUF2779 domain-containing protein [Flavimarina sp. Hel_I_48]|uniref:DUF2779 domain-containing protein n=1 Tax=Flavimarina sp. Hel_I_48 TaxID=1392488 RepID=UPI000AF70CF9|nr:DUF2779 domain-containing protein [Flavimarina sp. Hel_I_48]
MQQLSETDFNIKPEAGMISNSERRWLQVVKTVQKDPTPHFAIDGLKNEMKSWIYPLNCIDFETTAVAIPFLAGIHPYEQLAFQFSHHVIYEDGRVEHRGEYINTKIGTFPNFDFLRALKSTLSHNSGSIFRYHNHENTILNVIYNQLKDADEPDKQDLMDFIQQISHNTGSNADQWTGPRDMIDLHKVVLNYYYDPAMAGSNSIKAVLPAALNSSEFLKDKYSKPLDHIGVSSLNFPEDYRFIHVEDNNVVSPYKKLPPLFEDWDADSLDAAVTQIEGISDGWAALVAYAKLQFQDVTQEERMEIENGLLRYCELDTLAMVMILEYFKDVTENFQ